MGSEQYVHLPLRTRLIANSKLFPFLTYLFLFLSLAQTMQTYGFATAMHGLGDRVLQEVLLEELVL
jgi:hypothetical protein